MTKTDYFFWYGSIFSPLLPLLFSMKRLNRYQSVIVVFILLSFSADLISRYLISRNYSFLHLYGLLEALVLLYFFSLVIERSKRLILGVAIVFSAVYIVNSLYWEVNTFNMFGRSLECLIMISLSFVLFYQFYNREDDIFIDRSPIFWINIAILVYFSGAFFSFVLSREILSGKMPWVLHNASNMFKNILLAVGLWKVQNR